MEAEHRFGWGLQSMMQAIAIIDFEGLYEVPKQYIFTTKLYFSTYLANMHAPYYRVKCLVFLYIITYV